MDKSQPHLHLKFSSFSTGGRSDEKHREIDRNFSLGLIKLADLNFDKKSKDRSDKSNVGGTLQLQNENEKQKELAESELGLAELSNVIDEILVVLTGVVGGVDRSSDPPEIRVSVIEKFLTFIEDKIAKYESNEEIISLLGAIRRVSKLTAAVTTFSSTEPKYHLVMNRAGSVLQNSMSCLEDEFYSLLLDDPRVAKQDPGGGGGSAKATKRSLSFGRSQDFQDLSFDEIGAPPYSPETVERLHGIADSMISAGYVTECCQVFTVARRNSLEAVLTSLGFEKISIDDVVKMPWESLEAAIVSWNKAFRHMITVSLANEQELCKSVFSGHYAIAAGIFHNLVRDIAIQLLTFAEAVAMAKRSPEKLFKVLDMYETLRDTLTAFDDFAADKETETVDITDVKSEISSIQSGLGEAAVAIFCDLENSIKTDGNKTPVPGGAVHPLTRYVMNYLKYACEYNTTLEQVFKEHKNTEQPSPAEVDEGGGDAGNSLANQLMEVMDLLHLNMETKSKLYRDLALSNIFLMNNGRYIMQKIKGAAEIRQLLGDQWSRKRSSDLRQYHKNYQRETWSKVLACFKDEGLQVKGSVAKPVLKERLKSFNAMVEEIHKTQSTWMVSDEQLQSELRVSISAVIVPAYRSFLGRYSQHLDPGRQSEKYIKFAGEDLETYIDELFDGNQNPSSLLSRKK